MHGTELSGCIFLSSPGADQPLVVVDPDRGWVHLHGVVVTWPEELTVRAALRRRAMNVVRPVLLRWQRRRRRRSRRCR